MVTETFLEYKSYPGFWLNVIVSILEEFQLE